VNVKPENNQKQRQCQKQRRKAMQAEGPLQSLRYGLRLVCRVRNAARQCGQSLVTSATV
jgi:hypothetical protein